VAEEGVAVEEDAGVMDNWDTERFDTTFAADNSYGGWNENDDNLLDENEFYGSYYDTWDVNNDNILDEGEWNTATGTKMAIVCSTNGSIQTACSACGTTTVTAW